MRCKEQIFRPVLAFWTNPRRQLNVVDLNQPMPSRPAENVIEPARLPVIEFRPAADGDLWPILANGIKEGLVEITEAALREIIQ